jgi:hypothetical protein
MTLKNSLSRKEHLIDAPFEEVFAVSSETEAWQANKPGGMWNLVSLRIFCTKIRVGK